MKVKQAHISQRGLSIPTSPIHGLIPLALEAKRKGIKIYHVNIGDPDFSIPDEIKNELKNSATLIDKLPYPPIRGNQKLIQGWIQYFNNIKTPTEISEKDILITAGASDAMTLIASSVFDPGDEFIVFEPFYAPYATYASLVSAHIVPVSLDINNGYHLPNKKEIVEKITKKTRAIFFTNPNNPTGTVFTKQEIEMLLDICDEYGIFLVADETYRGMVFDSSEALSVLHVATEEQLINVIIGDSLSKRLNVCGARVGAVISKNATVIESILQFLQGRPLAAFLEQEIVARHVANSLPYVEWLSNEYRKRRDIFISTLEKHTGFSVYRPEGAFYTMVKLPIKDSVDFAKWMLTDFQMNNETVMVGPGSGFYATPGKGLDEIRVAYVLNEQDLEKAAVILAEGIKAYQAR